MSNIDCIPGAAPVRCARAGEGGMNRRRFLATLAAGAAGVAAPSIAVSQGSNPIRIGFVTALTGPYSVEAQWQVRGAELAVREFNDAGGLNGRRAELLLRDDKLNAGEAATRTLELIEKDKVQFVVGSISAAVQLSINNITRRRNVIFVSVSMSDAINEASDWSRYTFHEALTPHMSGSTIARHVFPRFGRRAVILAYDAVYGAEMSRAMLNAGRALGVDFVDVIRHPIGQTDYSSFFPRILAARPDVLMVANFGRDQLNCFKQAYDFGLKKHMRIVTPNFSLTARQIAGHEVYAGIIGCSNFYWSLEDTEPAARAFNGRFLAMHKAYPTDYAAYAYSGTMALFNGMRAARSGIVESVAASMRGMKYNHYKGPQHFRICDSQSVQSVLIMESKDKSLAKHENDTMKIIAVERFDESGLRTCDELGHKG